jgi:hypothetical protein
MNKIEILGALNDWIEKRLSHIKTEFGKLNVSDLNLAMKRLDQRYSDKELDEMDRADKEYFLSQSFHDRPIIVAYGLQDRLRNKSDHEKLKTSIEEMISVLSTEIETKSINNTLSTELKKHI